MELEQSWSTETVLLGTQNSCCKKIFMASVTHKWAVALGAMILS
jgi:hypothetical protein